MKDWTPFVVLAVCAAGLWCAVAWYPWPTLGGQTAAVVVASVATSLALVELTGRGAPHG